MKKFTFTLLAILAIKLSSYTQSAIWAVSSDSSYRSDDAYAVDVDNYGNKYIGGSFYESIVIDGVTYTNNSYTSNQCGYVAKYDAAGNVLWVRIMESILSQVISLKVNRQTGECYSQGVFYSNLIINGVVQSTAPDTGWSRGMFTKFDANGNALWTNVIDAGYGIYSGVSIAIAPSGNSVYVIYLTILPIVFQTGETYPAYAHTLARLDGIDGHILAVRTDIPLYLLDASILACDKDGNVILAGNHRRNSMNEVNPVFPLVVNPSCAIPQGFVWKMDPNFVSISGKEISGGGSGFVSGIGTDKSDNVFIYGTFDSETTLDATVITPVAGSFNSFVAKIYPPGTYSWINQLNADGGFLNLYNDAEVAFAVDKNGKSYLGGGYIGTLSMDEDSIETGVLPVYSSNGYLIKLNKNGAVR